MNVSGTKTHMPSSHPDFTEQFAAARRIKS